MVSTLHWYREASHWWNFSKVSITRMFYSTFSNRLTLENFDHRLLEQVWRQSRNSQTQFTTIFTVSNAYRDDFWEFVPEVTWASCHEGHFGKSGCDPCLLPACCMFMYVYACTYIYINIYVYMYKHLHVYLYVYIWIYIYLHIYVCSWILYIYIYIYKCKYICTYIYICVYINTCKYIHIRKCI